MFSKFFCQFFRSQSPICQVQIFTCMLLRASGKNTSRNSYIRHFARAISWQAWQTTGWRYWYEVLPSSTWLIFQGPQWMPEIMDSFCSCLPLTNVMAFSSSVTTYHICPYRGCNFGSLSHDIKTNMIFFFFLHNLLDIKYILTVDLSNLSIYFYIKWEIFIFLLKGSTLGFFGTSKWPAPLLLHLGVIIE